MLYKNFVNNYEYKKSLNKISKKIQNISNIDYVAYDKQFITNKILTTYRQTIGGVGLDRVIENLVLDYAIKSERSGALSSDLFFIMFLKLLKNNLNIENDLSIIKTIFDSTGYDKEFNEELTFNVIKNSIENKLLSSMVIESIRLAGLDGKIVPVKSPKDKYSIELRLGNVFPVSPYCEFLNNDSLEYENVRCFIVDGTIEKESEIHNILSSASITKESLFILARGFGEEVLTTLSANHIRGNIKVIPVRVPYEVDSINMIADICVCCGNDVITPFKGDLISTKKLIDLPIIKKIKATKNNITIENDSTQNQIINHVNDLHSRRQKEESLELIEILDKRINCFSSRLVMIRLGYGTHKEKLNELENIDYGLRIYNSIFQFGAISNFGLCELLKNKISNGLYKLIESLQFDYKPIVSIYSAIYYASKVANLLSSINSALIIDA